MFLFCPFTAGTFRFDSDCSMRNLGVVSIQGYKYLTMGYSQVVD